MRAHRPAILCAALLACAHAPNGGAARESIQWLHDDYDGARAKAQSQGKPLLVDVWATWCHSCLSMQRYVFSDPGMAQVKDAAVYLAIDQELPQNRAFLARFPLEGLPTFLLLDPKDESIAGRWLGSGSVADLRGFVEQGALAIGAKDPGSMLALARAGDQAQQHGDFAAAAAAYEEALQKSDARDGFRPQLLVKLASALGRVGSAEAAEKCAALGLLELPRSDNGSLSADLATTAVGCAEKTPRAGELRALAEVKLQQIAADDSAPLSADDRSDALGSLVGLLDEDGRKDDAVLVAGRRKALLLAAQSAAPDTETASTFDGHLTETYLRLDELPAAEALLTAREKEMPKDFNPPARLARVLLKEKKLPEAEAAAGRALALMTSGPRRASILALQARIFEAEGKSPEPAWREELQVLQSLPEPQRVPKVEAELRAKLEMSKN